MFLGDRSVWGRGYASEAVRLRTAFAFNELNLERLESESIAQNIGMHRALEKSGYQKIGRRRHVFYRSGQWLDSYIFELLRDEWQMRQE
jgi:RimJ/RimL family protein N-acetyltransferase